jgi:hypothetical protein
VVVFVDVVDGSDVEPRAVVAINGVGGLMEYFSADGKFVGHLSLEQHTREPKIFVTCAALVDPIAASAIDGPIAETLLKPHRQKHLDVAHAEAAVFVAGGQIDLWKYRSLRSPALTVLLDESVLETNRRVAIPVLHRAPGGTVERRYSVNRELAIGDEAVIKFYAWQSPSRIAAHNCPG